MNTPMDILTEFPVRKTAKQKRAFQEAVRVYAEGQGYGYREEKGSFGCRNMIIGDPESAEFLVTAHYDTCAALPIPNLVTPCALLPFLGWQLVLCAWMILLPVLPALAVGFLTGNYEVCFGIWHILFWVGLAMMIVGPANRHNANDNTYMAWASPPCGKGSRGCIWAGSTPGGIRFWNKPMSIFCARRSQASLPAQRNKKGNVL